MRVELLNTKKTCDGKIILDIDNLLLKSGKVYAVLGPNGAGKSTMLRILSGIDRACSGNIYYNGKEMMPGKNIAYMPQKIYMFDMTVIKNVTLGIRNSGISNKEAINNAKQALDCIGMSNLANAKARHLSGGEAQRVALARTLALGKKLVLLDEPASATDITGMELVEKYIKTVNEKDGSTIVFSTHNPSQAARIADEVIIMHCGRVIEKGNPINIFNSPQKQGTIDFLKSWRL